MTRAYFKTVAAIARVRIHVGRRRVEANATRMRPRRGTTIIEFVVACSLLSALILLVVPSAIRIGRVQRTMRHERIAMDEVTNQLDRLTRLSVDQIKQEITSVAPSKFAEDGLPNPRLTGTLRESEDGYRVALEIAWDGLGERPMSLTAATWVFPTSTMVSLEPNALTLGFSITAKEHTTSVPALEKVRAP